MHAGTEREYSTTVYFIETGNIYSTLLFNMFLKTRMMKKICLLGRLRAHLGNNLASFKSSIQALCNTINVTSKNIICEHILSTYQCYIIMFYNVCIHFKTSSVCLQKCMHPLYFDARQIRYRNMPTPTKYALTLHEIS